MAIATHHPGTALTDEQITTFRRDGFIVLRGLLEPHEVDEIRETFMQMGADGPVEGLSEMPRGGQSTANEGVVDPLARYPRMMHPHRHADKPVGPVAKKYMLDPRLERVLSELMGEPALAAQSMFYFKPPGARGQDFHQDNFYLRVKPGTCVAAWCAIDRCDADNGGMMCVPETGDYDIQCPQRADSTLYFTSDHVPIPEGKTAVLPIMNPGDVLLFNGSTIHGSGPNRSTDRFRRSLIFHYVPRSTSEISSFYELCDFAGMGVQGVRPNTDGGPCGTASVPMAPH